MTSPVKFLAVWVALLTFCVAFWVGVIYGVMAAWPYLSEFGATLCLVLLVLGVAITAHLLAGWVVAKWRRWRVRQMLRGRW